MKKSTVVLLATVLFASAAIASPGTDVVAPIHQFIDGFNRGDAKSAYATYASGSISITDEFAPHIWAGADAAHAWAAAYERHSKATGVTDGAVKYGDPTRTEIEGDLAYVVIPAIYTYKEKGNPTIEEGQMTFVLHHNSSGWKIRAWTWTGVKPHAPK